MKKTKSAGGIVLNNKGQMILVSQRGRSWSFPKGHIDEGETDLSAAKREIYEEAGISDLEFVRELGTYRRFKMNLKGGDDTSELKTIVMFLFETKQKLLKPVDPENPEARWVAQNKVAKLLTHLKDKSFFLSIINKI